MKNLLITVMILTSTFAFSESREEFKTTQDANSIKETLEAKKKSNKEKQSSLLFAEVAYTGIAAITVGADINQSHTNKTIPSLVDKSGTRKFKILMRTGTTLALVGLVASISIDKKLESKNDQIDKELAEITSDSRNDREKVSETSKETLKRKISAIDMN